MSPFAESPVEEAVLACKASFRAVENNQLSAIRNSKEVRLWAGRNTCLESGTPTKYEIEELWARGWRRISLHGRRLIIQDETVSMR